MNSCEKYREMLEEYIEGMLDRTREGEFLEHMGECPVCSAELEAEKALVESIHDMDVLDPGDDFTRMVMARIFTPVTARPGVVRQLLETFEAFMRKHSRLAWSPLVVVSLIAAFLIPYGLKTGAIGLLSSSPDMISLFVNPLAGLITSADRVLGFSIPILKALFLVLKIFAGFLWTLAGTRQFIVVLFTSVLIVMTAGIWTFLRVTLARRRIYHVTLRI